MSKKKKEILSRLQWKLILIFMLLIVSVILITGTFLISSVSSFYLRQFQTQMNTQFNGDIARSLKEANLEENPTEKIKSVLEAFSTSRLGINSNRDYYILDGKTGSLISSSSRSGESPDLTENIIIALSGGIGDKVSVGKNYMDYAYPLKSDSKVSYVIYIKDNKQDSTQVLSNLFKVIAQAMLYSAAIAFILGIFLSRTITVPIINLTNKASKMKEGKFDTVIEVKSNDEIGILTDTFNTMATNLKQTLDEISGEKDKISVILKNLTDGVIAFDMNGNLLHINPAAEKMLKINARQQIEFDSVFSGFDADISFDKLKNGETPSEEEILETDNYIISAHFAQYKNEHGKTDGIVVTLQDITKQQKLDESRKMFVANVSHELRTPLTNIKSYSETLLDANVEDEETRKNFLKVIVAEADRMTRLVKDLLVLSKFDHQRQALDKKNISIGKLTKEIVDTMKIEAKNKKQILTYVPGSDNDIVFADKDRINQVIVNIISNALKYTPPGGNITVATGQQEQYVYIKVSDTGIGIPEKDLPYVFDRFYRVDKARSRQMGGTGLGLAIAKEIIEAHSGTISVDSTYKSGSTFTVKLPISSEN